MNILRLANFAALSLSLAVVCVGYRSYAQATTTETPGDILSNNDILDYSSPYAIPAALARLSQTYATQAGGNAHQAIHDLLSYFWSGSVSTGFIVPVYSGYKLSDCPSSICPNGKAPSDPRGGIWGASTLYNLMYYDYQLTGLDDMQSRLASEWEHISNSSQGGFSEVEMTSCGQVTITGLNGNSEAGKILASDDSGWDAAFYLQAYDVTHDPTALKYAKELVACGFQRWQDTDGGLWYNDVASVNPADARGRSKCLCQVALDLDALKIYDLTGDKTYLNYALASYNWIETHLQVTNIYWMSYYPYYAPYVNGLAPDSANAVALGHSFIAGNMAMAVLHERLYKLYHDQQYEQKAIQTSLGILAREVTPSGTLMDDRDAWADGTFASDWVREVLPLDPSLLLAGLDVHRTALSIMTTDRTSDGLYGGDWGPLAPSQTSWVAGCPSGSPCSIPQQIMTSTNAADIVMAAAFLK